MHIASKTRRLPALLVLGLVATLLTVPLAGPAAAHGTYSVTADTSAADSTVNMTDGTPVKVRLLRPTGATPPVGGWPVIVYKMGTGEGRCANHDFMTRSQLASYGYVVVSMTSRGFPGKLSAADCGASDQATAILDSMDDSGSDLAGPVDVGDVKDVITWALTQADTNDNEVGFFGHSHDGMLAYHLALADSRIKAVFAGAGITYFLKGDNVAAVSNKPTALRAGMLYGHLGFDLGLDRHLAPEVLDNLRSWFRSRYLRTTVPSATTTWMNARTFVDDNGSVNKAPNLTTPIFVSHGFLDKLSTSPEHAIQAFNGMTNNTDKYLYLGACNTHGNPCRTNDATWLRNKVHDFFDKYLYNTGTSLGGPIFFAVPPTGVSWDNTNKVWTSSADYVVQTSTVWPPNHPSLGAPYHYPIYLRTGNLLVGGTGGAPTTNEPVDTISAPTVGDPLSFVCTVDANGNPIPYGTGESVLYESAGALADFQSVGFDADLWLSSQGTDRLQVVADLFSYNPVSGIETRLFPTGDMKTVPVSYGQAAGTKVNFKFKPATFGWTWQAGHKIRLRVASNHRVTFSPEPVPTSYDVHHTVTNPSKITLTVMPIP